MRTFSSLSAPATTSAATSAVRAVELRRDRLRLGAGTRAARAGRHEFALPVGRLALVVVAAGVAGVVAAALPARRAARLDVLAAVAST